MVEIMKTVANTAREAMTMRQCFTTARVEQGLASVLGGLFEAWLVDLVVGTGNLVCSRGIKIPAGVVELLVVEASVVAALMVGMLVAEKSVVETLIVEVLVVETLVAETSLVETLVGEMVVVETVVETLVAETLVAETSLVVTLVGEMVVEMLVVETLVWEKGESVENEMVVGSTVELDPAESGS